MNMMLLITRLNAHTTIHVHTCPGLRSFCEVRSICYPRAPSHLFKHRNASGTKFLRHPRFRVSSFVPRPWSMVPPALSYRHPRRCQASQFATFASLAVLAPLYPSISILPSHFRTITANSQVAAAPATRNLQKAFPSHPIPSLSIRRCHGGTRRGTKRAATRSRGNVGETGTDTGANSNTSCPRKRLCGTSRVYAKPHLSAALEPQL